MADPKLPDINAQLDALPYDEAVKTQLFNAFYAANENESRAAFESLPIPGKLKNDFYEMRQNAFTKSQAPPVTKQPPTEGIMARAEKNLPRSGANFVKGLVAAALEATGTMIPDVLKEVGIGQGSRLTQSVKNVGQATGKALKTGGVGAAIDAGLEQGVTEAFAPILGFAKHVASRVMNPMESFAEDPVGTVADVAAVAVPALRSEKGVAAINKAKGAVGIKPKPTPVKPNQSGQAAESAKVFESGTKPVSRERAAKIEELRSKIKTKPTAPPPVVEKPKPLRPDQKQLASPEKPRFVAGKDGITDTDTPPPFSPVEAEIIDPVPQPQKALPPASPAPRFYASETGEVADASKPVATPVPGQKQLPAPKTAEQQALPAAAEQKALPAPSQGQIDHAKIATEVNSDTQTVANLDKLTNEQLHDIIGQFSKDPAADFSSPTFDPAIYEQSRRIRNTAKAVMRERAAGPTIGADKPINYTPDTPVPQTKFVGGEEVPVIEPKSAVAVNSKEVAQPTPTPAPAPDPAPSPVEPQVQVAVEPQVPVVEPVTPVEAPITPPAKPVVKPPVASKPSAKPAAAPAKPKALEVAQAQVKASAPPTVKPAAKQEPVTPTVTAKAEAVEPVASPVPQVLKEGDGFTEASIHNGKASYKTKSANGNIDVKPGERAFYREIDGDTDIYTVRESGGKVNVYDIEDNVVASYPKGTPAEKAMEQKFGRTVTTAQAPAPQIPATPAKSSPIPKKKEQPVAKEVKAEEVKVNAESVVEKVAKSAKAEPTEPIPSSKDAFGEEMDRIAKMLEDGKEPSRRDLAKAKELAKGKAAHPEDSFTASSIKPTGRHEFKKYGEQPDTIYVYGKDGSIKGSLEIIRGKSGTKIKAFNSQEDLLGSRDVADLNEPTYRTVATEYGIITKN